MKLSHIETKSTQQKQLNQPNKKQQTSKQVSVTGLFHPLSNHPEIIGNQFPILAVLLGSCPVMPQKELHDINVACLCCTKHWAIEVVVVSMRIATSFKQLTCKGCICFASHKEEHRRTILILGSLMELGKNDMNPKSTQNIQKHCVIQRVQELGTHILVRLESTFDKVNLGLE